MKVVISKSAGRSLLRSNKRMLIARKIGDLASAPEALAANVTKLQGRVGSRLRVQDWRIIFRIDDGVLYIDEIEPRGAIYEDRT